MKTCRTAVLALVCLSLMVPTRAQVSDVIRKARLSEPKETPPVNYVMTVADDWLEFHDTSPRAGSHRPRVSRDKPDNSEECMKTLLAKKCEPGNEHCTDKLGCDFQYLLGPPQRGMYGVNPDAPLWQWEVLGTYGSALECERARIAMKRDKVVPQAEEAWQTEATHAFCMSLTDPRIPDMENERKWHKWPYDQH